MITIFAIFCSLVFTWYMLFLVNMWSVELVLRTYSYKKLFVWKKSLWNIFCLKEIFDLGSIHKGCSYVIGGMGVAKKHTNADRERGCSIKNGRPLRKKTLKHIFSKILKQIICHVSVDVVTVGSWHIELSFWSIAEVLIT